MLQQLTLSLKFLPQESSFFDCTLAYFGVIKNKVEFMNPRNKEEKGDGRFVFFGFRLSSHLTRLVNKGQLYTFV